MVQTDRRERRHEARRAEFLAAARTMAEEDGLDALTIKGLAARLDCAVGTMYTYFGSKGALLAALQADAIARLAQVHAAAADRLEPTLAGTDESVRPLARLVAFGRFVLVAERRMPEEFHLQQQLLGAGGVLGPAEVEQVVPVAFDLLARPQDLLADAVARRALRPGNAFDRTVTWVAAINGVLVLEAIGRPETGLFDTTLLADRLTLDLLRGWGADGDRLAVAAEQVPLAHLEELFVP